MPFNGSGIFQRVRNWVNDATAGIKIRADYHDAEDDNLAAGLSNTITRDGQSQILQNIPWNSKRITGLADPVNPQDASTKAYADTKLASGSGGGTMTGDMTVTKDAPTMVLNSTGAGGSNIQGQKSGKMRWLLRLGNDTAESGANVGSNFDLHRYDDAGNLLAQSLLIGRADGRLTITGPVTINGDPYSNRGANEGVLFLGSNGSHYLYFNGDTYSLPAGRLALGADGVYGGDAVTVNQLNTKQGNLGFTPVQQGGGYAQYGSKIYIGWDGGGLRAQVDGTDLGRMFFGAPSNGIQNVRLQHAGDTNMSGVPTMYEPHGGACVTGLANNSWVWRWRYVQITWDGSNWGTVAYSG